MKGEFLHIMLIVFLLYGCRKDRERQAPDARVSTDFLSGQTTDIFTFSAGSSLNQNERSLLYYRWDFGTGEGWSTLPSKNPEIQFRYYSPGQYQVRLEVINSEGLSDSTSVQIEVTQGYSSPRGDFQITPEMGNIFTDYLFDASATCDDEDSLETLLFRWDFDGDGLWDRDFDSDPTASWQFGQQNKYNVLMEVKDPSGLSDQIKKQLSVGLTDYDLNVDFTWSPPEGTEQDTFLFDASLTHHPDDPEMAFTYQWQLEEGEGWTEPSDEPTIIHKFRTIRTQTVRLKVTEPNGLTNTTEKELYLNAANKPPFAKFILSIPRGNIRTQFYFTGWTSFDHESLPTSLKVRWDFEGDGQWDTPYDTQKKVYHQYEETGTYYPVMEVIDEGGLTDQYQEEVYVSPYTNETGICFDGRDGEIYGTVKIGDQWWFAESVRYEVTRKQYWDDRGYFFWDPWEPWKCLEEYPGYCDLYGKYYHITSAVDNTHILGEISDGGEVIYEICPRGWHIPYDTDLKKLYDHVGSNGADRLVLGGDTDFGLQYLGYIDWYIVWKNMLQPQDTVFTFEETYQSAWLFSQNEASYMYRTDIYMLKFSRNSNEIWEGYDNSRFFIPVRCVKDEE